MRREAFDFKCRLAFFNVFEDVLMACSITEKFLVIAVFLSRSDREVTRLDQGSLRSGTSLRPVWLDRKTVVYWCQNIPV